MRVRSAQCGAVRTPHHSVGGLEAYLFLSEFQSKAFWTRLHPFLKRVVVKPPTSHIQLASSVSRFCGPKTPWGPNT